MTTTASRARRASPVLAGLLLGSAALLGGCYDGGTSPEAGSGAAPEESTLLTTYDACKLEEVTDADGVEEAQVASRFLDLGDDDLSLTVTGRDNPEGSAAAGACVMDELGAPAEAVAAVEEGTEAEEQTVEWDSFTATWTSDPVEGLDLLVEESS